MDRKLRVERLMSEYSYFKSLPDDKFDYTVIFSNSVTPMDKFKNGKPICERDFMCGCVIGHVVMRHRLVRDTSLNLPFNEVSGRRGTDAAIAKLSREYLGITQDESMFLFFMYVGRSDKPDIMKRLLWLAAVNPAEGIDFTLENYPWKYETRQACKADLGIHRRYFNDQIKMFT